MKMFLMLPVEVIQSPTMISLKRANSQPCRGSRSPRVVGERKGRREEKFCVAICRGRRKLTVMRLFGRVTRRARTTSSGTLALAPALARATCGARDLVATGDGVGVAAFEAGGATTCRAARFQCIALDLACFACKKRERMRKSDFGDRWRCESCESLQVLHASPLWRAGVGGPVRLEGMLVGF